VLLLLAATWLAGVGRCEATDQPLRVGVFLVADPGLTDPNFHHTVVLITHYGTRGAMGVVINRPTDIPVSQVLPEAKTFGRGMEPLFRGGPVALQTLLILVNTRRPVPDARRIFKDVYLPSTVEGLADLTPEPGDEPRLRVYAGYAGWAPGQLEAEIEAGGWRLVRADAVTVFQSDSGSVWADMTRRGSEILIHKSPDVDGDGLPEWTARAARAPAYFGSAEGVEGDPVEPAEDSGFLSGAAGLAAASLVPVSDAGLVSAVPSAGAFPLFE